MCREIFVYRGTFYFVRASLSSTRCIRRVYIFRVSKLRTRYFCVRLQVSRTNVVVTFRGSHRYCKQCKTHQEAVKSLEIWRLPPILVCHSLYFSQNIHLGYFALYVCDSGCNEYSRCLLKPQLSETSYVKDLYVTIRLVIYE